MLLSFRAQRRCQYGLGSHAILPNTESGAMLLLGTWFFDLCSQCETVVLSAWLGWLSSGSRKKSRVVIWFKCWEGDLGSRLV